MEVIEFPRMKKADEISNKLTAALISEAKRLGLDTMIEDFVFDMAWVHKFVKATVDNQYNVANDLCRLTRAQGIKD